MRPVRCSANPGLTDGRTKLVYNGVPGPGLPPPARTGGGAAHSSRRAGITTQGHRRRGRSVGGAAARDGTKAVLEIVGSLFPGVRMIRGTSPHHHPDRRARACGEPERFRPDVWDPYREADIAVVPSRTVRQHFRRGAARGRPGDRDRRAGVARNRGRWSSRNGRPRPVIPGALACAIRRLSENWPAASERPELARREAREKFSVDRYGSQIAAPLG
jgi:hypothetical protein